MSELASLLTAIGGLITAIGGPIVAIYLSSRTSRRERTSTADNVLDKLRAAAEDGAVTPEELAAILRKEDDQ